MSKSFKGKGSLPDRSVSRDFLTFLDAALYQIRLQCQSLRIFDHILKRCTSVTNANQDAFHSGSHLCRRFAPSELLDRALLHSAEPQARSRPYLETGPGRNLGQHEGRNRPQDRLRRDWRILLERRPGVSGPVWLKLMSLRYY